MKRKKKVFFFILSGNTRTSFGKSGAKDSNLPILPSLNVKSNFLIHSCGVLSRESRIGCMSWEVREAYLCIQLKEPIADNIRHQTTHEFPKVVYCVS